MGYEIEFIGVNKELQDADAICMRWEKENGEYIVGVFDAGFKAHGEALVEHIKKYYFNNNDGGIIDFIICSHSHQDHVGGIKEILENFEVKALYMNRPWMYVDDLYNKVEDERITKTSLENRLRERYTCITELENIANEKEIEIHEAFQGKVICNKLKVLSPTKELYLKLLVESDKTPLCERSSLKSRVIESASNIIDFFQEYWNDESLRENVETDPENEMSVVILGEMDTENFLLTGDVGIRGFEKSIDYAKNNKFSLKEKISIYQIPHHGGRHNVSPSILNELVGKIIEEDKVINKKAFVCVGKNSNHPKKMVVNSFVRRGVKVYKTGGKTIRHSIEMPKREGWSQIENLKFSTEVEKWS